jgi:hypothetical protein
MKIKILILVVFSFLGGIAGSLLMTAMPLNAAGPGDLVVYNQKGQRVGFIGALNDGQGTMFLFNEKGGTQIQMGSYGSGPERGQSLIGLHDREDNLRFLLRLYGEKDSPTMVMKDDTGADRLVIGLDGTEQTPYIQYMDSQGQMKNLLAP